MRISDVNLQNSQYFMNLLGLKNTKGLNATPTKGSSTANQMAGPFDLATLQRMAANDPTIKSVSIVNGKPHYEIDTSKVTNQFGLTGMVVTPDTKYEMVSIPKEVETRLTEFIRDEFINSYGQSRDAAAFKEEEDIFRDALTATSENERTNVGYTIGQKMMAEGRRIRHIVEEAIPGWKPGDVFDRDFVRDLIEGKSLDIKA
jgi:hypothetical protein